MHWFFRFIIVVFSVTFLFLLIWIVIPKLLPPQKVVNQNISGFIFRNQIWEGTVRIEGDLIAVGGTTITIKPGAVIVVSSKKDKFNLDLTPWHLKSGINVHLEDHGVYKNEPFWDESKKIQIHLSRVDALGTKQQPIIIKSDAELGSPYDFNVLSIKSGVLDFVRLSNYRRLEIGREVTLSNNFFSEVGECAICISSGKPTIFNNEFKNSLRESIWIYRGSPRITDNIFLNLSGAGIRIDPKKLGQPIISYNNFEMPENDAIDILTGMEREGGMISFNKFAGNSYISLPCDSKIKFVQNSILSIISFKNIGCGGSYSFGPNYWGIKDEKGVLVERIINKDRNFKILIPTILPSPPKDVGKRS